MIITICILLFLFISLLGIFASIINYIIAHIAIIIFSFLCLLSLIISLSIIIPHEKEDEFLKEDNKAQEQKLKKIESSAKQNISTELKEDRQTTIDNKLLVNKKENLQKKVTTDRNQQKIFQKPIVNHLLTRNDNSNIQQKEIEEKTTQSKESSTGFILHRKNKKYLSNTSEYILSSSQSYIEDIDIEADIAIVQPQLEILTSESSINEKESINKKILQYDEIILPIANHNIEKKAEQYYEIVKQQLFSLKVEPDLIYLQPNKKNKFTVWGFDKNGDNIDCGEIIWSAKGGKIDQNGNLTVDDNAKGIYEVKATSKNVAKHSPKIRNTLLTFSLSTRILSWILSNKEFFNDVLAPQLDTIDSQDTQSEIDIIVQEWLIDFGRRKVSKLLKKVSNFSFREAFSNINSSTNYIVLPELRKLRFISLPSYISANESIPLKIIGIDQTGDRIDIKERIIWSATSGKISSEGIFTDEGKAENVKITVNLENKNFIASTNLKIVKDTVCQSSFTESPFIDDNLNDKENLLEEEYFEDIDFLIDKLIEELSDDITGDDWFDELSNELLNEAIDYLALTYDDYKKWYPSLSWFYKSQVFYDGFTIGEFSYEGYIKYREKNEFYSNLNN